MDAARSKLMTQQYDIPHSEGDDISMTAVSDPAGTPTFAAVTTAIVNVYEGVVITTTTTGNDQTIQSPTNVTAGNRFTVVNSSTSTDSIDINGFTLEPSESQEFLWDGAAWVIIESVDAEDITAATYGDLHGTTIRTQLDELDDKNLYLIAEGATDYIGDYHQKIIMHYYDNLGSLDMTEYAELYIIDT